MYPAWKANEEAKSDDRRVTFSMPIAMAVCKEPTAESEAEQELGKAYSAAADWAAGINANPIMEAEPGQVGTWGIQWTGRNTSIRGWLGPRSYANHARLTSSRCWILRTQPICSPRYRQAWHPRNARILCLRRYSERKAHPKQGGCL